MILTRSCIDTIALLTAALSAQALFGCTGEWAPSLAAGKVGSSGEIGVEGGSLNSQGLTLQIPAGALAAPETLSVTQLAEPPLVLPENTAIAAMVLFVFVPLAIFVGASIALESH